ncbi:core component of ECF transporter [Shewanella gelidii]|uniref:Core component of ECF transporter n=1 Tax=Shewanella gelidii TaxID=1642821 RepID=A0A917JU55_9GAMM|nr:core component of ECF transporter [Shewanella gelidii]MCL1099144.1 core component of ECF transporter [Shewanella gelidii]GGI81372.1 hypothetical protein GCM10009332_18420 [Shewanella gelidii]
MNMWRWDLKGALFIGFCAALLVAFKGLLRMKLGLSGHSMLLMTFMYLVCLAVVPRIGAITACGLVTGALAMLAGVGKGGPLLLIKFGVPAIAMDVMLLLGAGALSLRWRCLVLAIAGSLAWATKAGVVSLLAGMTWQIASAKFAMSFFQGGAFAVAGALLVPMVVRKLVAHDVVGESGSS